LIINSNDLKTLLCDGVYKGDSANISDVDCKCRTGENCRSGETFLLIIRINSAARRQLHVQKTSSLINERLKSEAITIELKRIIVAPTIKRMT
jgi:hypothetical protein